MQMCVLLFVLLMVLYMLHSTELWRCVCVSRRRYVEEDTLMKKLYITNIQRSDEATYRCQATRRSFQKEKQVRLIIYSVYSRYFM